MIEHLSDYMASVKGEFKLISKHASMVITQVEQVLKAQNDLLNELNNKKNEILDIFYKGLTNPFRDNLDSCDGCVFTERIVDQAEILLNNMLTNENNWTLPEPTPKSIPKKRGILFLSPEDMQEAKKSMKEKGIKVEDVKNLPPVEEIHGLNSSPIEETHNLNNPTQEVR